MYVCMYVYVYVCLYVLGLRYVSICKYVRLLGSERFGYGRSGQFNFLLQ